MPADWTAIRIEYVHGTATTHEPAAAHQDLRALAAALDGAQKVGRLTLGASTENAAMSFAGEVRIAQSSELDVLSVDELEDLLRLTRTVVGNRPLR